ncbi:hypothetical protein [Pseudomonas qingdaonensis]|uniref:hypothetical protein n=1 Tax=Pseudomonas qingdaonensis TaxID=2056231 RepID=UPI0012FE4AE9|nr:hypothetical protein [Pseudomonas qingdaonensis]
MQAIVKYEYLLSPAFRCEADVLRLGVELEILTEHVCTASDAPLIEDDAINRMIEAGYFPSENLFKERLSRFSADFPYCAHDFVHMINRITQKGRCVSEIPVTVDVEWGDKSLEPNFERTPAHRLVEMTALYERLCTSNHFENSEYATIYSCLEGVNEFEKVTLQGVALDVYPDNAYKFPLAVGAATSIFGNYNRYLSLLDGRKLFSSASEADLKKAFYVGALNLAAPSGGTLEVIPWRDFDIGSGFYKSMMNNECAPGMKFDMVLFDAVVHILAGCPKYDVDVFTKTSNSDEPRTHGRLTAYRTHVTKSGRALRLMFWRAVGGGVTFANVGNKFELEIFRP